MASIEFIKSQTWGISITGYGNIVVGVAAIKQCIRLIISTRKNTDPLRPAFGSNIFKYVDAPAEIAIPNIKREILEAIAAWEKRVRITRITHRVKFLGAYVFSIEFTILDENIREELLIGLEAGNLEFTDNSEITIQANIPTNPDNYPYQISFTINGKPVLPNPEKLKFESAEALKKWVVENWNYLGRWHILNDRLVVNVPASGINTASMNISLYAYKSLKTEYPTLTPIQFYHLSFTLNGQIIENSPILHTPAEVAIWLNENFSHVALWENVQGLPVEAPIFSTHFTTEFETDNIQTSTHLLCHPINGAIIANLHIQAKQA